MLFENLFLTNKSNKWLIAIKFKNFYLYFATFKSFFSNLLRSYNTNLSTSRSFYFYNSGTGYHFLEIRYYS